MDTKILVTYASKYGNTKEIAVKIGEVIGAAGLQADVVPVDAVRDLSPYQAVVLGSAIYIGKWHPPAVKFLHAHEKALAELPVWLFSSGPTGEGDPVELVEGLLLPPALKPLIDRIHPRDVTLFHGNIDPDKVNFIERWAVKSLVKKPFGDFRKWDAIASWAESVAVALKAETVGEPSRVRQA